jgi:predicted DNA-binding transcriptional regulator AlpA
MYKERRACQPDKKYLFPTNWVKDSLAQFSLRRACRLLLLVMQNESKNERQEPLLNTLQAAEMLNVSPRCLSNWRHRGGGPNFIRLSSSAVRYRTEDVEDWLEQRLISRKAQ